jgi:hypothetical protein
MSDRRRVSRVRPVNDSRRRDLNFASTAALVPTPRCQVRPIVSRVRRAPSPAPGPRRALRAIRRSTRTSADDPPASRATPGRAREHPARPSVRHAPPDRIIHCRRRPHVRSVQQVSHSMQQARSLLPVSLSELPAHKCSFSPLFSHVRKLHFWNGLTILCPVRDRGLLQTPPLLRLPSPRLPSLTLSRRRCCLRSPEIRRDHRQAHL